MHKRRVLNKVHAGRVYLALLALLMGIGFPAKAREAASTQSEFTPTAESPPLRAGYEDVPQFGGPSSVAGELKEDNEEKETVFRFDGLQQHLEPYFDFKARMNEDHGLAFGTDYTALYQRASEGLSEDQAASGIFRVFGTWTAFGRESGNAGSVVFKVEHRHTLGTNIPPQGLGFAVGYAGLTAGPFSDFGWGLTNFYWQQKLNEGRLSLVAGIVDTTDYVDIYGLVNPWTSFSNLAFLTDPTIPAPNQGLGAAFGVMATDNIYVIGGLADSNGDPTDVGNNFDTFFSDAEYFSHMEVGWTSDKDRIYLDNVHVTAWHADERTKAGVPGGWGLAFSAARFIDDKWLPFLRAGYADDGGALWEASVSAGFGYYIKKRSDLMGLGLNWSRPSPTGVGPGLNDQYTVELFYRVQLSQNFAITPDLQLLIDPALNPSEDQIWIFGLRGRLSF